MCGVWIAIVIHPDVPDNGGTIRGANGGAKFSTEPKEAHKSDLIPATEGKLIKGAFQQAVPIQCEMGRGEPGSVE